MHRKNNNIRCRQSLKIYLILKYTPLTFCWLTYHNLNIIFNLISLMKSKRKLLILKQGGISSPKEILFLWPLNPTKQKKKKKCTASSSPFVILVIRWRGKYLKLLMMNLTHPTSLYVIFKTLNDEFNSINFFICLMFIFNLSK